MKKILWGTIYFLVYMVITIAFAELLPLKNPFSINYMQLKRVGDWLMLLLNLLLGFGGAWLIARYLRLNKILRFWLGQLGMLMLVNGIIFFSCQVAMTQFTKLNYSNLKRAVQYITLNYYAEYAILMVAMFTMLFLNKKRGWLNKNPWFYFVTMAPYIVEVGYIFNSQLAWNNFIDMNKFSYHLLYKMFLDYGRAGNHLSLLLLDDSSKAVGITMLISAAAVIYIGGEYLVYKAQKAHERRKKEAEGKQKEIKGIKEKE